MRCCLSKLGNILLGIVLVALGLLAAGHFLLLPHVDMMLSDAVRREFMLPPSSEVEIEFGRPLDTYQGKVKTFTVRANEAKLEGLMIEDVHLNARGIQFNLPATLITGDAELSRVDHADLSFRVSEEALEERWARTLKKRGISDVKVDLTGEHLKVSGLVDLKLTKVRVSATGDFEVEGRKIRLNAKELDVGGTKVGLGEFKDFFSKTIRAPLLDLGELRMGVTVKRLESRNGYLIVEAETQGLEQLAAALKRSTARRAEQLAEKRKPESDGEQVDMATETEAEGSSVEYEVKSAGQKLKELGRDLKERLF